MKVCFMIHTCITKVYHSNTMYPNYMLEIAFIASPNRLVGEDGNCNRKSSLFNCRSLLL